MTPHEDRDDWVQIRPLIEPTVLSRLQREAAVRARRGHGTKMQNVSAIIVEALRKRYDLPEPDGSDNNQNQNQTSP